MQLIILGIIIFILSILILRKKCFGVLFMILGILLFPISFILSIVFILLGIFLLIKLRR